MGFIKEPEGIDLVVGPSILTEKDKEIVSGIIANYRMNGHKPNRLLHNVIDRNSSIITERKKISV